MATQFSGGTIQNVTFTGTTKQDILANLLAQTLAAGWTNVAQAAGQGPGGVHTITMTIASPCVVTDAAHGFLGGEKVVLQTSGALPAGLSPNVYYYIKYIDANTYNLATSLGGANINTSGSQSGTHKINTAFILIQSATQGNVTRPIRVRMIDNLGTCVQFHIENQAGTVKSANQASSSYGGQILPGAGRTYRIIATQYHFLCFIVGVCSGRDMLMAGMLYVPSVFTGVTDLGYMFGNGTSDSGGNGANFRSFASLAYNGIGNFEFIYNTNYIEMYGGGGYGSYFGCPEVMVMGASSNIGNSNANYRYRWGTDMLHTSDMLLSIGLSSITDEAKIKGQFFDMLFIAGAFAIDSTDTFNGHTWLNLTNNYTGGTPVCGGVWVATS